MPTCPISLCALTGRVYSHVPVVLLCIQMYCTIKYYTPVVGWVQLNTIQDKTFIHITPYSGRLFFIVVVNHMCSFSLTPPSVDVGRPPSPLHMLLLCFALLCLQLKSWSCDAFLLELEQPGRQKPSSSSSASRKVTQIPATPCQALFFSF